MIVNKTFLKFCIIIIMILFSNRLFSDDNKYKHIAHFNARKGAIKIKDNIIKVYKGLSEIKKYDMEDQFRKKYPLWNDESYHIYKFNWDRNNKTYKLYKEKFGNCNITIKEEIEKTIYVSDKSWFKVLPKDIKVKSYKGCDIDNDQTDEIIIFIREIVDNKKKGIKISPGRLFIIDLTNGKYNISASLSPPCPYRYEDWTEKYRRLAEFKIEDINNDNILEILIWNIEIGVSWYTIRLDIFAKEDGQKYFEYKYD